MSNELTENEVIDGVKNYLRFAKGKSTNRNILSKADADKKEHGVDLALKLSNDKGNGNYYYIEAKGNLKIEDGKKVVKKSDFMTEFRWAISQIVLRIKTASNKNNRIYGIAIPRSEKERCLSLIKDNWALRNLGVRLYCAYREKDGELTAEELTPSQIYTEVKGKK